MTDTFWADTSEHQRATYNDSYPHRIACFRSNDGTYQDGKFAANLAWARRAADEGRIDAFIVYFVWRQNWQQSVGTHMGMCGPPHPKQASMLDIESWGGKITGDQSDGINRAYWRLADYYGDKRRTIGYGGAYDLPVLWPDLPPDVRLIIAGYGVNPGYRQKFAHQYTDGQGFGGGLPEGAPPFGVCDMNVSDGLSSTDVAAMLGIGTPPAPLQEDDMSPDESRMLAEVHYQMTNRWVNPRGPGGTNNPGEGTLVELASGSNWMAAALISAVSAVAAANGSGLTAAQIEQAVRDGMASGVQVHVDIDGKVVS